MRYLTSRNKRRFFKTWRNGLLPTFSLFLLFSFFSCASDQAVVERWTRKAKDYSVENLEMTLAWHATYLGPEFREVRRRRIGHLEQWNQKELEKETKRDEEALSRYDEFFVSIYAGSSFWPHLNKETGRWRLALVVEEKVIDSLSFERVPIREREITLYPYLDKWSKAFLIRFPKSVKKGNSFRLRMKGVPAKSELVWGAR